jgi:hypothetical protein
LSLRWSWIGTAKVAKEAKKKRGFLVAYFRGSLSARSGDSLEMQLGMRTEIDQDPKMKGVEPAMVMDRNRESCERSEKEKRISGGVFSGFSFNSRFPFVVSG